MVTVANLDWLEQIYRQHRRQLFLTAWAVLHCSSLAEDAVHSAFVHLAQLSKAPREPKLYAFRAVRNAAIDLAKTQQCRRQQSLTDLDPSSQVSAITPVDHGADHESLEHAQNALIQLDANSREVVELHLHSDLTFQEIATLCDTPLQTVASRYRRALEKIRKLLEVIHE